MRVQRLVHQHRFDLAADALLLASGFYAITTSVAITVFWLLGGFDPGSAADAAVSDNPWTIALSLCMLVAGVVIGPGYAWKLHGHRIRPLHLLALVGGPALMGAVALLAPVLATIFGFVLRPVTDAEFAGPICVGVLLTIGYLVVLVHAMRDAVAPAGDPPLLERLRLLSIVWLLVLVVVVGGAWMITDGGEITEALIMAELMGFCGAGTVTVAAFLDGTSVAAGDQPSE